MTEYCFPYEPEPSRAFGSVPRPIIEAYLRTQAGGWFRVTPYADSGADFSVMPKSVCKVLGLKLKAGQRALIGGISGRPQVVYIHQVQMRIGAREFTARVGFAFNERLPYLLGRMDVLEHFDIRFELGRVCFAERANVI